MPLSEEERKRLEELELQLLADDPKLAHDLQNGSVRGVAAAHAVLGALIMLAGIGLVITGISTNLILIGVSGFLIMGAGGLWVTGKLPPPGPWT